MVRNTLRRALGLALVAVMGLTLISAAPARTNLPTQLSAAPAAAAAKKKTRKQRNIAIARPMARKRGWSDRQFRCLVKLWTRESNWNHRAHNRSSGAYGIPQAMPGRKMRSAGKDWRTNPKTQIKWGLRYIKSRYGTPCRAWSHFGTRGWY